MQVAKSIVMEFQQVEVCLECSAKQLRYVSDVFLHALKACLNPALPLFNPQAEQGHGAFTPLFCKAFKRIFIVNDVDKVRHPDQSGANDSYLSSSVLLLSACIFIAPASLGKSPDKRKGTGHTGLH